VVLLGGDPSVSERAAQLLDQGAGLIRAIALPMLTSVEDESARSSVDELARFRPDIVFLALGSPKQEAWFLHWRDRLPDAVYIGSGAAADFAAGHRRRAPGLLQAGGLEWVWRLLQEPRRLAGRYLVKGPRFVKVILDSHAARKEAREARSAGGVDVDRSGGSADAR
jgi:N-acetylglucosaminyldiphosphoundecaprenol N-acetyl-beta-D-mannosaminyltransferase